MQLAVVGQRAVDRDEVAVEGGALVRVFAVAHFLDFLEAHVQRGREVRAGRVCAVLAQAGQVIGDRAVVLGGMREHFLGQAELGLVADRTGVAARALHFSQHNAVVGRIDDHDHVAVVLGGRTQHGRATDVDVLNCIFQRALLFGDGLLERVQIDHDHVDLRNIVLFQFRDVLGEIATGQDAAVHFRVQRLDAAIEHFRETGVIGHFRDRHAIFLQQLGGAASGQDVHAQLVQRAREIEHAGLVGYGNESLFDHGEAYG